jgi:uncharacterized membrane protein (DUF4010 family)
MMFIRVLILVAVLATRIWAPFAMIVTPALIVAVAAGGWLYHRAPAGEGPPPAGNPIALLPALGFVVLVALAAVVVRWAEGRFGDQGIAILLFVMGALDVDASIVTVGGMPTAAIGADLAAMAIAGTIIANMTVKIAMTAIFARGKGGAALTSLFASTAVLAVSVAVAWTEST